MPRNPDATQCDFNTSFCNLYHLLYCFMYLIGLHLFRVLLQLFFKFSECFGDCAYFE